MINNEPVAQNYYIYYINKDNTKSNKSYPGICVTNIGFTYPLGQGGWFSKRKKES